MNSAETLHRKPGVAEADAASRQLGFRRPESIVGSRRPKEALHASGRDSLSAALIAALLALSSASGQGRVSGPARSPRSCRSRQAVRPTSSGASFRPSCRRRSGKASIIENRGGAAGNIGMGQAARAKPDGYTLLMTSTAIAVNTALFKNLPYDPIKDFAPISELVNAPNVLVVRPEFRHRDDRRSRRAGEGAAQHVQLRQPGRRHQVASHRRAVEAARRHRHGARAVSRRRPGGAGRAGRDSCRSRRWRSPPPSR